MCEAECPHPIRQRGEPGERRPHDGGRLRVARVGSCRAHLADELLDGQVLPSPLRLRPPARPAHEHLHQLDDLDRVEAQIISKAHRALEGRPGVAGALSDPVQGEREVRIDGGAVLVAGGAGIPRRRRPRRDRPLARVDEPSRGVAVERERLVMAVVKEPPRLEGEAERECAPEERAQLGVGVLAGAVCGHVGGGRWAEDLADQRREGAAWADLHPQRRREVVRPADRCFLNCTGARACRAR